MLRLLTYLVTFLKLLVLGKWYPPAHVKDVSAADYEDWCAAVNDMAERLVIAERAIEATQRKVYRDEKSKEGKEVIPQVTVPPAQETAPAGILAALEAGDRVPDGLL